ncbi:MAG: efflux transporter outer membrane subunit [Burkholderiaceae bacterium]|nr:efflux transporter outer membrane subunit [Burkholderiaceae bacterium]
MTARRPFPLALRATTLVLVAAGVTGCGTMIPEFMRPAAPVPASYPGTASTAAPDSQSAADIEWQRYFGDPRLQRLIETALNNNRDLRVAVLNIEQARAQYQVRRADEFPTVNGGITGSRQPKVGDNGSGSSISSTYTAGLSITSYEFDFFGRVRSLSAAQLAQFAGTEEARKTVQISLVASVANAWLGLLADGELLAVTRRTLTSREESMKLTQLKFDHGASSELDVRQAESLLEGARVALAQQTRQRALDENALALLLGQPVPADALPPVTPVAVPAAATTAMSSSTVPLLSAPSDSTELAQTVLADLPAGLPSELLNRRPDIRQAEQQLIAANANIGAARAAFFPRITLSTSVGIASTELSDLFKGGTLAWSFAPQLVLPIFDAGRNQANLDAAQVNRDIAVAQYEKAVQSAFREVADALAGRATLGDQLRAQQAQARAEETRTKLADLRYRNGASSYLDVLDAQRSLFTAQQAVVQAQAAERQNRVTLYKVLGGGWKDAATQ